MSPTARGAVLEMIREFKEESSDLETARARTLERLRTLKLSTHSIDFILRRVSEQTSKKGLIAELIAFAASLSCEKPAPSHFLSEMAAREVGFDKDTVGLIEDWYTIVPLEEEACYVFVGSALSREIIRAPWIKPRLFRRGRVYLRGPKGLYVTDHRSLTEFRDLLDPYLLMPIDQSLLVNIKTRPRPRVSFRERIMSFVFSHGTEALTISRRHVSPLRKRLGAGSRG